jgi:cytochrome c biogenesis protein CcmG, thiol:disulfide interchange protein DsbE
MKTERIFFIIPLFLLLAMGPAVTAGGGTDTISPLDADKAIKTQAPDFTLPDVSGKSVTLASLRGKVVLLNFWATWCPPCKAEMPSMNRLYNSLRERGLEVIAVSSDNSLSAVRDFLEKNRVDFRVVFDEKKSVTRQFHVFSMPTTFLIDKTGLIVEKLYGEYDWTDAEMKTRIEKLL